MTTRVDIESFNCEELCLWLQKELIDDVGEEFLQSLRAQRIKGRAFLELTDEELKEIAPLLGERKAVKRTEDSRGLLLRRYAK